MPSIAVPAATRTVPAATTVISFTYINCLPRTPRGLSLKCQAPPSLADRWAPHNSRDPRWSECVPAVAHRDARHAATVMENRVGSAVAERLRQAAERAIAGHQYSSAAFWTDKAASLSGDDPAFLVGATPRAAAMRLTLCGSPPSVFAGRGVHEAGAVRPPSPASTAHFLWRAVTGRAGSTAPRTC